MQLPRRVRRRQDTRIAMQSEADLQRLSDLDLIAAINRGDEAAFEALYYRHRDWVANLAFRWTGDRELALDVLQETFFVLAKKFPGFQLTSKLQTFLFPVIRNLAITARRKSSRYQPVGAPPAELESVAADNTSENDEQLRAALASLGQEHRDVLLLRFVDGLQLAEIAEVLGIPLGTVKSRLHNSLETLRANPRIKTYFEE
jgi:RNA polymerase sigma-70 factor (ECF subfamily)